jgi:hypothetical protein
MTGPLSTDPLTSNAITFSRYVSVTVHFAPVILAALAAMDYQDDILRGRFDPTRKRQSVAVHGILAVILDDRGKDALPSMTWGELCGIVREARGIWNLEPRRWNGRALNQGLGYMSGVPELNQTIGDEAVADDTLEALACRLENVNESAAGREADAGRMS